MVVVEPNHFETAVDRKDGEEEAEAETETQTEIGLRKDNRMLGKVVGCWRWNRVVVPGVECWWGGDLRVGSEMGLWCAEKRWRERVRRGLKSVLWNRMGKKGKTLGLVRRFACLGERDWEDDDGDEKMLLVEL